MMFFGGVAEPPHARTGLFIPELQILAVAVPHTTKLPASVLLFRAKP
jgi:hypothetical protein